MWLKLMRPDANIAQMVRPTLVNGKWRNPVLSGRNKAQLKSYFNQAGVPWIYEPEKP